ncbi:hypothetical protein E4T52_16317 [Aureobasidium sp. EXF-3400]|nr:hypothetical protein E4T51_15542 [Aureobasidium sp. EXF-12344]KAI4768602.1 hypothetical protein E4T52_16317 [Aureobasidium sp. EXF-3400]
MPRFLLCLPNELIKRVVDYLDRESILKLRAVCKRLSEVAGPTFCQTFFTYRCHALSKESMLTLIDILKHPEFGSHIQNLAFNATLPAVDCFPLKWDDPPWGEEDERYLESISDPLFSRSRIPQAVDLHYRLAFASPRTVIQLTHADFLIRPNSNFGSYMVNVTESLEKLRRPINIEINDYALGDTIKTHGLRRLLTHHGPRMYTVSTKVVLRIILHTVGWMQMIGIPVNRLSIELTSRARAGIDYGSLSLLGYYLHNLLVGNNGFNFRKDMALRLAFGRNDWDGFPDGQGLNVLSFLLDSNNIRKLEEALDSNDNRIIILSDEERDAYFEGLRRKQIETRSFMPLPAIESLSRDTGAKILNVVANATQAEPVKIHLWSMEFLADDISMEWAWVVDLDKKVLEAYTHWDRYKIVDEKSRYEEVLGNEKKLPGLVKRFGFDELPKDELTFLGEFEELLVDEEDD